MVDKKNLKQRKMGHKLVSDGGAKKPKDKNKNKNNNLLKKINNLSEALANIKNEDKDPFNLKELEKALKNIVRKNDLKLDTRQILDGKRERTSTKKFEPEVFKPRNSAKKNKKKSLTDYLNSMDYHNFYEFLDAKNKNYIEEINEIYKLDVSPTNKEAIIEKILKNNDDLSIKLRHKGYAEAAMPKRHE